MNPTTAGSDFTANADPTATAPLIEEDLPVAADTIVNDPSPDEISNQTYRPGKPFPQGATWDGQGVNFALYPAASEAVELWLSSTGPTRRVKRIAFACVSAPMASGITAFVALRHVGLALGGHG